MIFLDTNVIVRLIDGEPREHGVAAAALVDRFRDELYLPPAVFCEVVFVLRSYHRMDRYGIAASVSPIIDELRTAPAERRRMQAALAVYAERNVGILDAWLTTESMELSHRVATFDADLRKLGADVVDPLSL